MIGAILGLIIAIVSVVPAFAQPDPNKTITMTLGEWRQLELDIQASAVANYVHGQSADVEKKLNEQANPPAPKQAAGPFESPSTKEPSK